MAKLTLSPSGETIFIDDKKSILEHLRTNGIYVKSSCGGHATCTDCIIKVKEGVDNLNAPTFDETKLLGNVFHITKERLSCQAIATGDVTIDISMHSKEVDEEKRDLKNKKVASKFKVRKKEEFDKILAERQEKFEEKKVGQENWKNHWEKEGVKFEKSKSLGGNRRPRGLKDLELVKNQNKHRNKKS